MAASRGGRVGDARPAAPTLPAVAAPALLDVGVSARRVGVRPMSSQSDPSGAADMRAPQPIRVGESCRPYSSDASSFRVPSEHQASLFFASLFRPAPAPAPTPAAPVDLDA